MAKSPQDLNLIPVTVANVEENIDSKLEKNKFDRGGNVIKVFCQSLQYLNDSDKRVLKDHYLLAGWETAEILYRRPIFAMFPDDDKYFLQLTIKKE